MHSPTPSSHTPEKGNADMAEMTPVQEVYENNENSTVLSFKEFKKALGPAAAKYTDAQINQMRLICDRLADAVFDDWLSERNAEV
jgi:hypothetical protein